MKNIKEILKADFKKFPIRNFLSKNDKISLYNEYNLSNFFLFKRRIKLILINFLNRISKNKIYLNNSRSLKNVKKKYDKISGSYIRMKEDKESLFIAELNNGSVIECNGNIHQYYADILSKIIYQTKSKSFLEVGAGELTFFKMISDLLKKKSFKVNETGALDISFKRLFAGKNYLNKNKNKINYIVQGNAAQLPFANDSFDLIYTCCCLEQVPELFKQSVNEMLRVAKNYVVLIEPSYELSNKITSNYIYYKGYIQINKKLLSTVKQKYFKRIRLPLRLYLNGTELIIYKIKNKKNKKTKVEFICPKTKKTIIKTNNIIGNENVQYKIQNQIYKLVDRKNI
jgi:ubiquinone/menaquinone biosynthesis C-methylase UbiE